jgi:hypothetical protein
VAAPGRSEAPGRAAPGRGVRAAVGTGPAVEAGPAADRDPAVGSDQVPPAGRVDHGPVAERAIGAGRARGDRTAIRVAAAATAAASTPRPVAAMRSGEGSGSGTGGSHRRTAIGAAVAAASTDSTSGPTAALRTASRRPAGAGASTAPMTARGRPRTAASTVGARSRGRRRAGHLRGDPVRRTRTGDPGGTSRSAPGAPSISRRAPARPRDTASDPVPGRRAPVRAPATVPGRDRVRHALATAGDRPTGRDPATASDRVTRGRHRGGRHPCRIRTSSDQRKS